ncbi:MAG TPA: tRNA 2-thiouridine(34) synthase MnmA, partial [Gammaproteobacteria bacterium]|nr:tRNA 2-thiouridine(34) synthase MnmA [Gammaproteobacteria bacterium]
MSGGVDSAVTALLLKQGGWRVRAMFMKNWEEDDTRDQCSAATDLKDAKQVCKQLDIPLETVNFSYEYWQQVFTYFLAEYQSGRTPNPDVLCNSEIKFKVFLDYCLSKGADFIATGHYARLQQNGQETLLLRGLDLNKDQSYFLHAVDQSALQRSLFPLGTLSKPRVRSLAHQAGLVVQNKRDSTGICFIGERNFREFLSRFLPACKGEIVDSKGVVLGLHHGLMYYTIGQRQGLGIGGADGPWYVAAKNLRDNTLLAVNDHNHPALLSTHLKTA